MDAKLSLHHDEMSEEDIQELTIELKNSLNAETDLTAELPEEAGDPGKKGEVITLGQIFLAALSSGTVVALLQVLRSYVERNRKLRIKIMRTPDGKKEIEIEAEHLRPGQIEQTAQAIKQLCDDA